MMDMEKGGRRRAAGKRSKAGETLTETLIAMLIIGLSSVFFLTMVGASGRIFRKSEAEYAEAYEKIAAADVQGSGGSGGGSIKVKGPASETDVPVTWYGEADYVVSYKAW